MGTGGETIVLKQLVHVFSLRVGDATDGDKIRIKILLEQLLAFTVFGLETVLQ